MSEPPAKRRKLLYFPDGTRIPSRETLRRRKNLLKAAREAPFSKRVDNRHTKKHEGNTEDGPNEGDCEASEAAPPTSSASKNVETADRVEEPQSHISLSKAASSPDVGQASSCYSDFCSDSSSDPPRDCESSDDSSPTTAPSMNEDLMLEDSDSQGFNVRRLKDFILCGGDAVMFTESKLMVWQVLIIILTLSNTCALSTAARRALIEATKLFAGPAFRHWNITDYEISQVLDPPDEMTKYHFYCQVCFKKLERPTTKRRFTNHEAVCEQCSIKYNLSLESPNYFITLKLKFQITSLRNLPIIQKGLLENIARIRHGQAIIGDSTMEDVYDSLLYRKLLSQTDENDKLLTYSFNTDGAPLFNSSKRSFWPVQLVVNELPPKIRFRYPLLVGLLIVKKEPSPDLINTFLKSFAEEANKLNTEGFEMKVDGESVHFLLKPLLCSVDSVARPILQNRLQFNGYHGCSWCYSMGTHTHGCVRFLIEENDSADRGHRDYVEDCRAVIRKRGSTMSKKKTRVNVRGVKGDSILRHLKDFDMIWGFARDYLHADLAGVVTQLTNMWSDSQCPIRLTKKEFEEVNERLMKMTPPREVHRLVRPLNTERAKWKASEWRSWLLFYAIPCLWGILPDYALQHFALLSRSIYTLLKASITKADLRKVEFDLQRFVIVFELLYGEKYMTFNVHSLKHLVKSVRHCGPLWTTSTFPFEGSIRNLKRFVHGPKGVYQQMSKRAVQMNMINNLVDELEDSPASLMLYDSLTGRYGARRASCRRTRDGVALIGRGYRYRNDNNEVRCEEDEAGDVIRFKRCIKSGTVVTSLAYKKAKKSNDTVFRDKRGVFVQVLYLLYRDETAFAKVSCFEARNVVVPNMGRNRPNFEDCPIVLKDVVVSNLFTLSEEAYRTTEIPVTDLSEKFVVMKFDGKTYVSGLPNTFEIQ